MTACSGERDRPGLYLGKNLETAPSRARRQPRRPVALDSRPAAYHLPSASQLLFFCMPRQSRSPPAHSDRMGYRRSPPPHQDGYRGGPSASSSYREYTAQDRERERERDRSRYEERNGGGGRGGDRSHGGRREGGERRDERRRSRSRSPLSRGGVSVSRKHRRCCPVALVSRLTLALI